MISDVGCYTPPPSEITNQFTGIKVGFAINPRIRSNTRGYIVMFRDVPNDNTCPYLTLNKFGRWEDNKDRDWCDA